MLKRIAILGPESTGKSQLAEDLAAYYNTFYVPEFARDFLSGLGRTYNQNDLLQIAKKQQENIQFYKAKANNYLFIDTELIVIKIWSAFKYKKVHPWIINEVKNQDYDLYLLTDIDLVWQPDPLREHPHQRNRILKLYIKELEKNNFPFQLISGQNKQRTLNAIKAIDTYFQS
ncbi:MAG: ATP-binding protein [Bacteroidales bacterium]|nr:ATP-binding protein [Bacteroidales bacterium]